MPDNLSQQDIQDLQDISSHLPAGHPHQQAISKLINSQPTQFEQERNPNNQPGFLESAGHTALDMGKSMFGGGQKPGVTASDIAGPGVGLAKSIYSGYKGARERGHGAGYSAAAGLATPLGVDVPGMEHNADVGNTAGVLGKASVPIAAAISPLGKDAISDTSEAIGRKIGGYEVSAPEGIKLPGGFKIAKKSVPEPVDPVAQAVSEGRANKVPTTMPKVPKPADPVAEAIKGGIANKVPTTMPKVPDPLSEAVKRGDANRLPGRIDQVGELNRQGLANKIPTRMNRSVGEGGAGGSVGTRLPDVSVIPEPREPVPGVPNNMGSTPRADLQDLAQSATPHAGQQLQSLGSKVIYEPRGGTGYGGPRQESIGTPLPSQEPAPIGLRPRPADETFVRQHPSSNFMARVRGGASPLPPELHADLEKQAGRPLSDEEANRLDRQNLENGMVHHAGDTDESSAIREEKRAQLEKPDPNRYKKKGK